MKREIIWVAGSDVRVGDELQSLWFMQGGPGLVKRLDPYRGLFVAALGEGTQVASFVGTSIQMTLCAKSTYEVSREGGNAKKPRATRGLRRHEEDETPALRDLSDQMNRLHAEMGGRDSRPERKALLKCMRILQKAIEDAGAGK